MNARIQLFEGAFAAGEADAGSALWGLVGLVDGLLTGGFVVGVVS